MDILSIALSGMQAAETQLNIAAANIANANTPSYRSSHADLVSLSTGGVAVAGVSQDTSSGPVEAAMQQGSSVNLVSQLADLTRFNLLYSANAAVVRIGEKTTGTLVDILEQSSGFSRHRS